MNPSLSRHGAPQSSVCVCERQAKTPRRSAALPRTICGSCSPERRAARCAPLPGAAGIHAPRGVCEGFGAHATAQGCNGLRAGFGPVAQIISSEFRILVLPLFWLPCLQACAFTNGCAELGFRAGVQAAAADWCCAACKGARRSGFQGARLAMSLMASQMAQAALLCEAAAARQGRMWR